MAGFLRNNTPIDNGPWSVSELTAYVREMFEIDYRLQDVAVSGEISNFTAARSGHLYFTLKDSGAQLKCVMWRSAAERLRFDPRDGDAIIAEGRMSVYEASGVYQLYADRLMPAGRGDLALAFEQLKVQLEAAGLFDPAHKKPLPRLPQRIGIVTSADAAALRDILNVLRRRFPLVDVLIAPTLVQGKDAPPGIVRALQWLDGRSDIDVIIVARGGGSLEDLWAFNDEAVARAMFAAQHPVISGVGHETDFTIADFVADVRAPTPSAAAELVVPNQAELQAGITGLYTQLVRTIVSAVNHQQTTLQALQRNLNLLSPRHHLAGNRQQLDGLDGRLQTALQRRLEQERSRLAVMQASLKAVSPLATLARGYAIVRDKNGRVVRSVGDVTVGDGLQVQVSDGEFDVSVQAKDQP